MMEMKRKSKRKETFWQHSSAQRYEGETYIDGLVGGIQISYANSFWYITIYLEELNNQSNGTGCYQVISALPVLHEFITLPYAQSEKRYFLLDIKDNRHFICITNDYDRKVAIFDYQQWQTFVDYVNRQTPSTGD